MKKYIAFFDLDKTLIEVNSARLIVLFAQKKKLLSIADIFSGIYNSVAYKLGFISTEGLMEIMTKWLEGVDRDHLKQLFDDLGDYIVAAKIRKMAESTVTFHRNHFAKNVILSASVASICKPVAEYLKMDDLICTQMELNDGVYTGSVIGNYCYGEEKLRRVISYCNEHNFKIEDAWYFADSISDIAVLNEVGHPICVTPDSKLRRYAKKMNWKIENW
jgi:HAD superfamily hydrolase (TIGR01490 family)